MTYRFFARRYLISVALIDAREYPGVQRLLAHTIPFVFAADFGVRGSIAVSSLHTGGVCIPDAYRTREIFILPRRKYLKPLTSKRRGYYPIRGFSPCN